MTGEEQNQIIDLLIKGINQRTRAMNYFRLYSEILAEIFDKVNKPLELEHTKEFCKKLQTDVQMDKNKYVLKSGKNVVPVNIMDYLVNLKDKIMDVESFTDICDLCEISDKEEMKLLDKKKEKSFNKKII